MANIASKTKDIYWGEFSETDLDAVLAFMRKGDLVAAKRYIDDDLGRSDFIFGKVLTLDTVNGHFDRKL